MKCHDFEKKQKKTTQADKKNKKPFLATCCDTHEPFSQVSVEKFTLKCRFPQCRQKTSMPSDQVTLIMVKTRDSSAKCC